MHAEIGSFDDFIDNFAVEQLVVITHGAHKKINFHGANRIIVT